MAAKRIKVGNFQSVTYITEPGEIEALLSQKSDSEMNNYVLANDTCDFPQLWVMVNGSRFTLTYFPAYGEAGYRSYENMPDCKDEKPALFRMAENDEDFEVVCEYWVSRSNALKAAKEFLADEKMPKSVKWLEL